MNRLFQDKNGKCFLQQPCDNSSREIVYYLFYLQLEVPTTLDVNVGQTILWVKDELPSGILLLDDKGGHDNQKHFKNFIFYYLSTI